MTRSPTSAIEPAEAPPPAGCGFIIPAFVKNEMWIWLQTFLQPDGCSLYSFWGPGNPWLWNNVLKQGNLLQELALVGKTTADPEVQRAREVLPFPLVEAENGDVKIQVRDRQYSPEEISAFIVREMKGFAEEVLGEEGKSDSIVFGAEPGYDVDTLVADLRAVADVVSNVDAVAS